MVRFADVPGIGGVLIGPGGGMIQPGAALGVPTAEEAAQIRADLAAGLVTQELALHNSLGRLALFEARAPVGATVNPFAFFAGSPDAVLAPSAASMAPPASSPGAGLLIGLAIAAFALGGRR